jgi:hypothetical protein
MNPLLRGMLRFGVIVTALFKRVWERIEPFVRTQAQVAKRAPGRFEALKRKEMELERLDRLRNPSDYQGR